jgi:hypothetical protein
MKLLNRFQSHASQQFHTRHADFLQRLTRSRPTWEERLTSSDDSSALTVRPLYGARHWLSAPGSRTQCKTSSALTVPTDDGPEGPFSLGPNSWFHTATLAKLKTPIGSPDLREFHQLYTGQVPDMTDTLFLVRTLLFRESQSKPGWNQRLMPAVLYSPRVRPIRFLKEISLSPISCTFRG